MLLLRYLRRSLQKQSSGGLRPATLLKKELWHRGFPVNFAKFFRKPIFINHYGDHFYHSMVSPIFTCPDKKSLSLTFCESMT